MAKLTNEQKYKTPEERIKAFRNHCNPIVGNCGTRCRLSEPDKCGGYDFMNCFAYWLTLEAELEKPMDCPFCGGACEIDTVCMNEDQSSKYVSCTNDRCMYQSPIGKDGSAAIAAHNRVCRAVKDFPVLEKMKIELLNIAHNGSKTTVAEIVEKYLALGTQERTVG